MYNIIVRKKLTDKGEDLIMRYLGSTKVICPTCRVELDIPLYHVNGINHYGMKFCH